jgi:hypothetical protein
MERVRLKMVSMGCLRRCRTTQVLHATSIELRALRSILMSRQQLCGSRARIVVRRWCCNEADNTYYTRDPYATMQAHLTMTVKQTRFTGVESVVVGKLVGV